MEFNCLVYKLLKYSWIVLLGTACFHLSIDARDVYAEWHHMGVLVVGCKVA